MVTTENALGGRQAEGQGRPRVNRVEPFDSKNRRSSGIFIGATDLISWYSSARASFFPLVSLSQTGSGIEFLSEGQRMQCVFVGSN